MAKSKTTRVKNKTTDTTIVANKRARHDYYIEDTYEAGVMLQGWEVKSLRMKKVQLVDSYVLLKDGEAFLLGCHVTPLNTANTHVIADPDRTKKLLLNARELAKLFAAVQQKGHTCVATKLYWKGHLVKIQIALAKGKQDHDKRAAQKDKEWAVDKQRIVRHAHR
ncbi:MAG: SsrA-binding protein SmpB [Gammaproteobacteria bacterium]|jgi:SsrA-binding protein|nr:SsrA-binding protein SmpB [Gammaproteobacteria bacterium]